jgi:hypothetical protein
MVGQSKFESGEEVTHVVHGLCYVIADLGDGRVFVKVYGGTEDEDRDFIVSADELSIEEADGIETTATESSSNDFASALVAKAQHPYVPYLRNLFLPGDRIAIVWIHSKRERQPGKSETQTFIQSLEMATEDDSLAQLNAAQTDGWHIYIGMNPLVPGAEHRTKECIGAIRSVYIEVDYDGDVQREEVRKSVVAGEVPAPHFIIQSSPGKYQFIWLVDGFTTTGQQENMLKSLQTRFKADPQSVDCNRVLRLPGFKNLKTAYGPDFPTSSIVEECRGPRYKPADFHIPMVEFRNYERDKDNISSEEIQKISDFVTAALDEAGAEYGNIWELPSGAVQIHLIECLWGDEHSDGKRGDADIKIEPNGTLGFHCFHSHCGNRDWKVFREELEARAGKKLQFGESGYDKVKIESATEGEYKAMMAEAGWIKSPEVVTTPAPALSTNQANRHLEPSDYALPDYMWRDNEKYEAERKARMVTSDTDIVAAFTPAAAPVASNIVITDRDEVRSDSGIVLTDADDLKLDLSVDVQIPPYNENLIRGLYAEAVDLIAGGTTIPVQFPHSIAKTFFGLRLAVQGVALQDCDAETRRYDMYIAASGGSKGWSMARSRKLFTCFGKTETVDQISQRIKIWDGVDSGAGLKEIFFDHPPSAGVLLYIDETADLGHKIRADRNPEIMSTMLTLAEGTTLGRGKSKKEERKQKGDARLAVAMCIQPDAIKTVFAGVQAKTLGLYNRITPEHAYPVAAGKTPRMEDNAKAIEEFYAKYILLDFAGKRINQGGLAERKIEEYWQSLSKEERSQPRRLKNLRLNHFLIQAGQMAVLKDGVPNVGETSLQDALDAIEDDIRQNTIRQAYLTGEASDNVGLYLEKIKTIVEKQTAALRQGALPDKVALTERQFCTNTHAWRVNEVHVFERAWKSFAHLYLTEKETTNTRGPKTKRYLPKPE